MSCILALVGCTQSNEGSPSGMWVHLQAWDCLCMISGQYVATSAKVISFETHCCKLQNPAPIIHLGQTWILTVPGSPSTDSSVEVHGERRALQIFHTQLRISLGSRTFLSALISPSWSFCPSVPYTLGLCGSYPLCVLFISFPKVCIRSPCQQAFTRCSPGTRPFSRKTAVSGAKSRSHSLGHSHQEASKIRISLTHTQTNKNHSRITACHVLRFTCLPAPKDPEVTKKRIT